MDEETMHSSSREFHAETGQTPAQASRPRRPPLTLAASNVLPLTDFDLDRSDELMLWAALVESGVLCTRLGRKRLMQVQTLAHLASLTPPLSDKALWALGDKECVALVQRLRDEAERMRADQRDGESDGETG